MFKRVLCVIVSCVLAFSVLTLPVSADIVSNNTASFISYVKSNFQNYKNGNISFSDFLSLVASDACSRGLATGLVLTNAVDLANFLKTLGVDIQSFWDEFYNQRHGGESSSENRDDIMQGSGAVLYKFSRKSGSSEYYLEYIYYGDYGLFYNITSDTDFQYSLLGGFRRVGYSSSGDVTSDQRSYDHGYYDVSGSHNGYNLYYGDWRYDDGTAADDKTTEIPEDPTPGYDDPSIPEDELEDFLEDLLNELSLQFPDLSTVEGLLAAILAQLQSINGKMDDLHVTVDNLSEVKTYLDMAIASIIANGSSSDNSAVVDELVKIREAIKEIDSNSVADWAALAELLGLTITDDDIDEETGEIKDSVISAIINGLMTFLGSLLGTSLDDVISISDVTELGTTGIRMLSALVDLLISLNSSFKFQVINSLLAPLQGVMLNNDTPSDLTFNFNYGGVSRSITILPASLLTDSFFANALFIVRTLVSFILLYNWLKWARSFFASSV